MKFRHFGRTVALAILASSLCAAAATAETTVRVSSLPIVDTAPLQAAIQQGYFKKEGLEVTVKGSQQGGAVGIPGMVAGGYDIVYSNTPSVLLAISQGIDLKFIAGSSHNPPELPEQVAVIARKEANLKSGKDFEGKSMAVNARNSLQWIFARAWVKKTGGDPDKVTYREVGFPAMVDAVRNKQVDGALALDPFLAFARNDPSLVVVGYPFHTVRPELQMAAYVTMSETVAKNPEMIHKFARALRQGTEWVKANMMSPAYLKLVNEFTKMDPKLIQAMAPVRVSADVDIESLKTMESLMREHGMLKTELDLQNRLVK
jgi:NitT/TauT family transport system substrate-binding protein